jgi:hypothetical protein
MTDLPPALVLLLGALILPFFRGKARWVVALALPALALAHSWWVIDAGTQAYLQFMGTDAINQPLSERRASSVSAYLKSRGIIPQRLESFGVGSRYPVAPNDTAQGRAFNRRVEITLMPITA